MNSSKIPVLESLSSQAERRGVILARAAEVQQSGASLKEVLLRTQAAAFTSETPVVKTVEPETARGMASAVVTGIADEQAKIAELVRIAAREASPAQAFVAEEQ